ncbi:hypothetical protein FB451DRAFT_490601 [Mycena latifolia]|nr:hypothetical protein FB451DRAFT_490601 [Mycena latifolia]
MGFPFPSRAKRKPASTSAKPSRKDSALPDVLWTSIIALKESADAFPPLKSAVGGVIALCDIAEIRCRMEVVALTSGMARLLHLNRNERGLQEIKAQLDDAYRDFATASLLRNEREQAQMTRHVKEMSARTEALVSMQAALSEDISWVSLYSKLVAFFGQPLMHGSHDG